MYNRNLQKIVEGPQNPPVKPLSGKDEIIEQPTNTPPQQTTPTLPTWVPKCIKNDFPNVKKTTSPKQVYTPIDDGKSYFYQDFFFIYYDKNNEKFEGTWECQGNNVLIKTKDGDEYSIPTYGGWKNSQQSNTNNTPTPDNTGTPTPRKRGTQLSSQDYEGIDFKYKYPGDKNYRYGVKGTDWYAKNINNQKVFNITKDGFTSSVDKLNTQFPNAFKEVVQPVSPETKTPVTTQDSTKVVTNVPPVKPLDSTDTGTYVPPVKPMDSTNTGTKTPPQVKFVDSTAYKLEKL